MPKKGSKEVEAPMSHSKGAATLGVERVSGWQRLCVEGEPPLWFAAEMSLCTCGCWGWRMEREKGSLVFPSVHTVQAWVLSAFAPAT